MGLAEYEPRLVEDALGLKTLCIYCELVFIMSEIWNRLICDIGVLTPSDREAFQAVASEILEVACQQSQSELSGTVEHMRKLRDDLLPLNLGRQTAARQEICRVQRTSCSWYCTWEQIQRGVPKAGSKRGLWETETEIETFLQLFGVQCSSCLPEGRPKRSKHLGHLVQDMEKKWHGSRGGGRSNPICKHLNKGECNILAYVRTISNYCKDKPQCNRNHIIEPVVSMPGNQNGTTLASATSNVLDALRNLPGLRTWLPRKEIQSVTAPREIVEASSDKPAAIGWNSLPYDLQENILQRVEFKDLFRFKTLSKACKQYLESDVFRQSRREKDASSPEGLFTAINYYIKNKTWRCSGFDLHSKTWRSLPTFSPTLQAPEAELFKEYSVCGHGGLMCADVSKLPKKGELIVFNPLTRKKRALPSLIYPRSPVLVHLSINSVTKSFKVIAAGSSTASDDHLSKKVEIFDSKTSQWEVAPDLPGPAFGLNEHQAGVCVDAVLYFISFLEGDCRRGVVAFDVEHKKWLDHKACPIPFSMNSNTLQLVETGGNVYLFSEQERGGSVEHCIDVLEHPSRASEKCKWRNVVRVKKSGGRGLQVYPEHTCVSFGDGKLCVFNTLTRDGVVYDMQDGKQVEVLPPPPPDQKGDNFFSLNPTSFTLQPSFDSDPMPLIVDPN